MEGEDGRKKKKYIIKRDDGKKVRDEIIWLCGEMIRPLRERLERLTGGGDDGGGMG